MEEGRICVPVNLGAIKSSKEEALEPMCDEFSKDINGVVVSGGWRIGSTVYEN